MRLATTVVVLGALGSLVACGHEHVTEPGAAAAVTAPPSAAAGAPSGGAAPTPAQTECAALAAPVTVSDAKDIRNVQLVGSAVFFQSGTTVFRVGKDGNGLTPVFTVPTLVRSFVDGTTLLSVESKDDGTPGATLRVITATTTGNGEGSFPDFTQPPADPNADPGAAPALPGTTAPTDLDAAGIDVFASDAAFFYLLSDGADADTLLQMPKETVQPQPVVALPNVLTHPQLHGTDLWYVQDGERVFKVTIDDGPPKEVFGIGYAPCGLAVDDTAAYCSVGTAVERRDLDGAHPTTLVDAKSSKTSAAFGSLLVRGSTLFVPSAAPDPNLKNVIVALSSAAPVTQKLVACGRGVVTKLSADATSVAWTEDGGGVFIAPR